MQEVTIAVAIIASLLVVTLRPAHALVAYIICLMWYPYYLAVSIGTVDILAGRVVGFVLLLRCLCDSRIRSKFVWNQLDTWVTLSMLVYVVVGLLCFIMPFGRRVESRGAFLMDTWLAYMVARFIVTDRARLISIIKCISIALVPLALLGVIESLTGWYSFALLRRFSPWYRGFGAVSEGRFGLARAVGPFGHSILFGGCFGMFLPLVHYLRHEIKQWPMLPYIISAVVILGALSSVSSGPWVMVIVVILCLAVEKHRNWLKPLLIAFVCFCLFTQIVSNRPFYHVLVTRFNPLSGAGWHRARLIDLAIEHFGEWWLTGYGSQDPGWGQYLGMSYTDVTNEFISMGIHYGLLGMIVLCMVLVTAFRGIANAYRKAKDPSLRSLLWALGTILFSVMITWMSTSFFGQLETLFYFSLGVIGAVCNSTFRWNVSNRNLLAQHCLTQRAS